MEENILLIDEKYMDAISVSDEHELQGIVTDFLDCYQKNEDKSYSMWLPQILQEKLSEKSVDEINEISEINEIDDKTPSKLSHTVGKISMSKNNPLYELLEHVVEMNGSEELPLLDNMLAVNIINTLKGV